MHLGHGNTMSWHDSKISARIVFRRQNLTSTYRRQILTSKSVFLFWLFNMAILCEHVHRLELRKSFNILGCCGSNVASCLSVILVFLILDMCMSEMNFLPYFSSNWQMRNTKFKKLTQFWSMDLLTYKNNDFLVI